jgi:uncharacterized membrane protein
MRRVVRYFFQGLLMLVPISITLYVIYYIVVSVGGWMHYMGININPMIDPIIGFISAVMLIVIVGMIGSSIIFQPFLSMLDHLVEKAPLIKTIYGAVKDLMSAFVGSKKRFNKPVLVMTNKDAGIYKLGFLTSNDLHELGITDKVAVYMPYSYAFSGMLIIVDQANIKPIDASSADVMKFIISGGVTEIDDHH